MSKYITIGMDLGNKKHAVCALDQAGNVMWRKDVANTPEALTAFFGENADATVAMETGLCCRLISALAKSCGCDVVVGNARDAGAYFGLTPGQYQSGDKDAPKHVTKAGSALMRRLFMTAANYILRASSPDTALKRHGGRICACGGKVARRKAKAAVARKLAVVMLAMLKSGKPYDDGLAAKRTATEAPAIAELVA